MQTWQYPDYALYINFISKTMKVPKKAYFFIVPLLIAVFWIVNIYSSKITVSIYDGTTGQPLIGAEIQVDTYYTFFDSTKHDTQIIYTDENGKATVYPTHNNLSSITVFHEGYFPESIGGNTQKYILAMSPIEDSGHFVNFSYTFTTPNGDEIDYNRLKSQKPLDDYLSDSYFKYWSWLANKKKDYLLCENITEIKDHDDCLVSVAETTKNYTICELIDKNTFCFASVAYNTNNVSICDKSHDVAYCELLFQSKKGICLSVEEAKKLDMKVPCINNK